MATIKDIAEYTGVSATTVSNVIHGRRNRVSAETVERIQKAIEELDYVPNLFARSLVSSSSKVIALIIYVPTEADAAFSDESFQMAFLSTIEGRLRRNSYYLMFRRVETVDELKAFLHNWNVDGMFVTGFFDTSFIEALKNVKTPIVMVDSYVGDDMFCDVRINDLEGGYLAASHLISQGHRRIAFASSVIHDGRYMEQRYKGYRRALSEAGIDIDRTLLFESGVDVDSCRSTAERITKLKDVTAVVATTDIMAAGLMAAFADMGLSVPRDISVVGFDDTPLSRMITPRLTTIRQDMRERAAAAADCLLGLLGGSHDGMGLIELPVELVVRDSTACHA